jgi:RNA recognition motif-containing protein
VQIGIEKCKGNHCKKKRKEEMTKKLYVGNIHYGTSEEKLSEMFAKHGEVVSVNLIMDRYTGQSRGFGFVEMSTEEEAKTALEMVNGQDLEGRELKVAEARERKGRDGE